MEELTKSPEPLIKLYNVRILRGFVAYLEHHLSWSHSRIEKLFKDLNSDISILQSDANWFDQALSDQFYSLLVRETGDSNLAFNVGRFSALMSFRGTVGLLRSVLSVELAYKNIGNVVRMFTKGSIIQPIEIRNGFARMRSTPVPQCAEKPYQCQNRRGLLQAVPMFFDCPKYFIRETSCFHRGAPWCEYEIEWTPPVRYGALPVGFALSILAMMATWFLFNDGVVAVLAGLTAFLVAYLILRELAADKMREWMTEQNSELERSLKTLARRHDEDLLIHRVVHVTSRMLLVKELCEQAAQLIQKEMKYDRVLLMKVDPERNVLKTEAAVGFEGELRELIDSAEFNIRANNSAGFLIQVVNTKRPILMRDVQSQLSEQSSRTQKLLRKLKTESFAAVPLLFEDHVLGVLAIENITPDRPLLSDDLELMLKLSDHLAIALTNAQSFEASERALKLTQTIERQERELKELFQKYVPAEIFREGAVNPMRSLSVQRKLLTIFFVDIVDFTTVSENRAPEEIADLLNIYIDEIHKVTNRFGGRINKIMGDGLLVYFEGLDASAVRAGLEMLSAVERINARLSDRKYPEIQIGIGAHAGICTLGNIGSTERIDYTLIGDAVNIASRIQTFTRTLAPNTFCISDSLKDAAAGIPVHSHGPIPLKGRRQSIEVYEILTRAAPARLVKATELQSR